jgi:ABC-2 type transport system ATP-binding protein
VEKGEIIGLLGPNGAGKTTTMRILTGFLSFHEGQVKIDGQDIIETPEAIKKMIGYLPENPLLYEELTVEEFLQFVARLKEVGDLSSGVYLVMEQTGLLDRKNQLISALSRGFKQRVGLAAALLGDPEILILDEPTSGLDPNQVLEIRKLIKGINKTTILSTHILPEVEELCGRVVLIDQGRIKAVDTIDGLKSMSQGNEICLLKAAEPKKAIEILSALPEVKGYEMKSADQIEIFLQDLKDRGKVIEKLLPAGLYEFMTPEASLEEVFHQLTLNEGAEV